ncbi:hypothetical protein KM540_gp018 [Western grey kangaroopox virus]|uniref:Uncharacterized protein n=1 Tax=Western grey kangaroopox virus TaxID=1566307 RepID=A0A2C9DSG6_9POXV|nr:hypothetical protein KM540_gp018 [Western grey kangaroopox virus]ATI20949.1 hypothetical protein [Western grey kangaroopox virus]
MVNTTVNATVIAEPMSSTPLAPASAYSTSMYPTSVNPTSPEPFDPDTLIAVGYGLLALATIISAIIFLIVLCRAARRDLDEEMEVRGDERTMTDRERNRFMFLAAHY